MSLISELQRRNVIRVAMAYVALAWLVVQVLDTLAPLFGVSDGAARVIVIILAIMLVPALAMAWIFEWTPDGLRRENEVDHDSAVARGSAKALDRAIIGVLALAVVYFAFDKFVLDPARDVEIATEAAEQARDSALISSYGEHSIAVVPFADLSPAKDQEYFSDGIAEEIISLLSRIQNLRVIARSSAFAFKGQNLAASVIADRLNVRYILEGSVRRAGDRLRITTTMIDASTDTQLWSENFDRDFGDIFAIQDEIAAEVVGKLEIEIAGELPTSAVVDPEAYALYLRAKDLVNRQNSTATLEAEEILAESLAIDDQHAAAWLLYWPIGQQKVFFQGMSWPEFAVITRDAVENALRADPANTQAKALLARLSYRAMTTWEGESLAVAYGMSLDPLDPEINRAVAGFLLSIGQVERALEYYDYVLVRDPMRANALRGSMAAHLAAGNYEAGLEANRRLRAIVGGAGGLWNKGMFELLKGVPDEALKSFEAWAAAQPQSPHGLHGVGLAYLEMGNRDEFDAYLAKLEKTEDSVILIASAYAWSGRHDEALALLDTVVDPPRDFGPSAMDRTPLFRGLQDYPQWRELMERRGTSAAQIAALELEALFPGPGLPPTVPVAPP